MKTQNKKLARNKGLHHSKRYGHHQKRSKNFAQTYFPYLPMTIILFLSIVLSGYKPHRGVLAYATEMSQTTLLSATNNQRSANGRKPLTLNTKLSQAAQAKANDMVARNYWSHNTPDGQEPWVFFANAGYQYIKAGENLAYGFLTSSEAVTGWMNSPSHRENLLDADFSEVGFGFANGNDYNNAGQETVVVAEYGQPLVLSANNQTSNNAAPVAETTPTNTQPSTSASKPSASNPSYNPTTPTAANQSTNEIQKTNDNKSETINSTPKKNDTVLASSKPISRIEAMTQGKAPWAFSVTAFAAGGLVVFMLIRHGVKFKRLLRDSEQFVVHHPMLDSTLFALVILAITLSRTVGFIR